MSVIIRLQGLPWTASAINIRRFFQGLSIPDGGVHIVGGEKGDAFIAFGSDEDARKAMLLNGGRLNDTAIQLFLSSKTEMQNIISIARGSNQPPSVPNVQTQRGPTETLGQPTSLDINMVAGFNPSNNQRVVRPFMVEDAADFQQSQQRESFPIDNNQFKRGLDFVGFDRNNQTFDQPLHERANHELDIHRGFDNREFRGRHSEDGFRDRDQAFGEFGHSPEFVPRNEGFSPTDRINVDSVNRRDDYYQDNNQGQREPQFFRGRDNNEGFSNNNTFDKSNYRFSTAGFDDEFHGNRHSDPFARQEGYQDRFDTVKVAGPLAEELGRFSSHSGGFHDRDGDFSHGPTVQSFSNDQIFRNEVDQQDFPLDDNRPWRSESFIDKPQFSRFDGEDRQANMNDNFIDDDSRDHEEWKPNRGKTNYVKASGMPWSVSYKDVRQFFGRMEIPRDGLKLINDNKGRRIGVAYIKFTEPKYALLATKKNGQFMGDRYVDVRFSSERAFNNAIDSYVPDDFCESPPAKRARSRSPMNRETEDNIVLIKSLPQNIGKDDIVRFFLPVRVNSNFVHLELNEDGRHNGFCFVQFKNSKLYDIALGYDKKTINGKCVDVYPSSRSKMDAEIRRQKSSIKSRPRVESNKSTRKDNKNDSNRITKEPSYETKSTAPSEKSTAKNTAKFFCVKLTGLPYQANSKDIKEFFKGLDIAQRGIHIVLNKDGTTHGVAFVEFVSSRDCEKATGKDNEYIGKRFIKIVPIAKGDMLSEMRSLHDQIEFGSGPGRQREPKSFQNDNQQEGRFSQYNRFGGHDRQNRLPFATRQGQRMDCNTAITLRLENVHFRATTEDILDFFRGVYPLPDSVQFYYRDDGRPTGNASVQFGSLDDADMAVREMNNQMLMGRPVLVSYP